MHRSIRLVSTMAWRERRTIHAMAWCCPSVVQSRPDLHPHLPMGNLAMLDVATGFHHLEPPHLAFVDFSLGPITCFAKPVWVASSTSAFSQNFASPSG
jgi:hypothetical protein